MKDISKQYIKDIKNEFSTFYKSERRFLKDFKVSVDEYTKEHPYTYESLVRHFGTPAEIIENYYYYRNEEQILKHSKYSFSLLITIGIICFIVTLSAIIYVISRSQNITGESNNCDIGHFNNQVKTINIYEER